MELSSVASTQMKHLVALRSSGCGSLCMTGVDHTLPWSGSAIAGSSSPVSMPGLVLAKPNEQWSLLGAKPKLAATVNKGDGQFPLNSTPANPIHWSTACKGKHCGRLRTPPAPQRLELGNRFEGMSYRSFHPWKTALALLPGSSHVKLATVHLWTGIPPLPWHAPPRPPPPLSRRPPPPLPPLSLRCLPPLPMPPLSPLHLWPVFPRRLVVPTRERTDVGCCRMPSSDVRRDPPDARLNLRSFALDRGLQHCKLVIQPGLHVVALQRSKAEQRNSSASSLAHPWSDKFSCRERRPSAIPVPRYPTSTQCFHTLSTVIPPHLWS